MNYILQFCTDSLWLEAEFTGPNASGLQWNNGAGESENDENDSWWYQTTGKYYLQLTATVEQCKQSKSMST